VIYRPRYNHGGRRLPPLKCIVCQVNHADYVLTLLDPPTGTRRIWPLCAVCLTNHVNVAAGILGGDTTLCTGCPYSEKCPSAGKPGLGGDKRACPN
jgi:hypothetical protein